MIHWLHVLIALLQYSGIIILIGALAMRHLSFVQASSACVEIIRHRLDSILVTALIALTISAPAVLMIRATMMTGQPVFNSFSALPSIFLQTHYGFVWLIRSALVISLWALVLPLIQTQKKWLLNLMLAVAVCVAWTLSAAGHAAGWNDFSWQQLTDSLHILSASLWAGSMLTTLWMIWPLLCDRSCQSVINQTALGLSSLAEKVFMLVIITGLINLYLQLSSPIDLWITSYGQILSIKICLVLMMLYFAFINRYIFLVRLKKNSNKAGIMAKIAYCLLFLVPGLQKRLDKSVSLHFLQILILETLCMFAVLICTSILRHGPPPPHMM